MNIFFQNSIDKQIAEFFLTQRTFFGIKFFEAISSLGNWQIVLFISLVIFSFLFVKKKTVFVVPYILVVSCAELLTYFGKIIFGRPRPQSAILSLADFSFPSGHAVIAVTFYGFLAYILIKLLNKRYKTLVLILASGLIILIGLSRLYLGVHYLSDVLAGYLLGLISLLTGLVFLEKKIKNTK